MCLGWGNLSDLKRELPLPEPCEMDKMKRKLFIYSEKENFKDFSQYNPTSNPKEWEQLKHTIEILRYNSSINKIGGVNSRNGWEAMGEWGWTLGGDDMQTKRIWNNKTHPKRHFSTEKLILKILLMLFTAATPLLLLLLLLLFFFSLLRWWAMTLNE